MNKLYTKGYFQCSWKFQTNKERLLELVNLIRELRPDSVLDVGCGRGFLVRDLNLAGIKTKGCDFAEYAIIKKVHPDCVLADAKELLYKDKEFDLVISTDFFEHIEEKELDKVWNEMRRVGHRVAARIATSEENPKKNDYHVTVNPKVWWQERFPELIILRT